MRVVTDAPERAASISGALGKSVDIEYLPLTEQIGGGKRASVDGLIVWADMKSVEIILSVKCLMEKHRSVWLRLVFVEDRSHLASAQAYALGATHVLMKEAGLRELQRLFPRAYVDQAESQVAAAMQSSIHELKTAEFAVAAGGCVDIEGIAGCADPVISGLRRSGLSEWLQAVRSHHEATYQHAMLVTGILVDFGLSLGMRQEDLRMLHLAAMLHDIGKARIPLEVLDKPGRLVESERELIELHPVIGYEALRLHPDVPPEVLDAVRHHHEYLDGSGYPDGLSASNISDIVRMTTVADIFAALIEARKYKPAMSREQAYLVLGQMKERLEGALVSAFEDVALRR
ncbi:HD-GYP domain-containing protein [Rhodopseudomonas sp.]|uniref:HD-GYP domain-containing protein n=1 Tax=Rhodopseudomonas sp. TaxID=1078 RepID=UPI0039E594B3